MKRHFLIIIALLALCASQARAQNKPAPAATPTTTVAPKSAPAQAQSPQQRQSAFDLTEYGVRIQPDARLIIVMAALDAAGFDLLSEAERNAPFRTQIRREQGQLDPDLHVRLLRFYASHRLHAETSAEPTPAEQAARYVSLAYALGPPPALEAPARTDDLPEGLLEVLDFAPLVREFYRKSGIEERLPSYMRSYQAAGDEFRAGTSEMVRAVLSYLHTRPETTFIERVPVQTPGADAKKKKNAQPTYTTREHERRFFIVPDLLAVPGTINFRVIGDDYYAVVPFGTNPASSELRRAYLQYVIDPFVLRYNREITERKEALKTLIENVAKTSGKTLSPDVYLTVSRSLVAAADIRLEELARLDALSRQTQARLARTTDAPSRAAIIKDSQSARAAINDDAIAQLSDAYERGAVLAFYFTEQLRGTETSGFDISNSFVDMIASFDAAREGRRLAENAEARARGLAAQKVRRSAQRTAQAANSDEEDGSPRSALLKKLIAVDDLLRLRNYTEAESRLRALLLEYPGEPRVFFALGETASLSARLATDEGVRDQRLNDALTNYRFAVNSPTSESDPGLLSRAHEAMGSILAFMDRNDEAMKEFDAAIQIGPNVPNNAYQKAVEGKSKLTQPK
jgi:tetratricopeptide (TPR) repeat protein